jgi:anti-anti-sigma factor
MTATGLEALRPATRTHTLTVVVDLGERRVDATVDGVVDVRTVGELRRDLLRLVTPDVAELTVDLSRASMVDHTGAAMLVHLLHRCRQHGVALRIIAPTGSSARRTLTRSGLLGPLHIEEGPTA